MDITILVEETRKLIELSKKQIELLEQILRVFRKYDDEYLAEIESGDARPG